MSSASPPDSFGYLFILRVSEHFWDREGERHWVREAASRGVAGRAVDPEVDVTPDGQRHHFRFILH